MKSLFFVHLLILITGCSIFTVQGMKPRSLEDFYTTTGVGKYFLTDIPAWANFDQAASCYRSTNIRFFDINALMKSYGLSYIQAIQSQALYNEEMTLFLKNNQDHNLTMKEEELLFYKANEKIENKFVFFDPPNFKRINLIWLDEILMDSAKEKKLNNLIHSAVMDEGVPVLVSFCLTRDEVEKKYPNLNALMLTAEMFSVFDAKGEKASRFQLDLTQIFLPDQKLFFYSQKKSISTDQLKGIFKTIIY